MNTTEKKNRWYEIRLRAGVRERIPYRYACKREDGMVMVTNGAYATGVETPDSLRARYIIVCPINDKVAEDITRRYYWELNH